MDIAFAGTPDFAVTHLEALLRADMKIALVITRPDKPGKRQRKPLPGPVKQLAEKAGLPVIQPPELEAAHLEGFTFDVMVVVAYGRILRQPVLDYPKLGCINVHASLLPRWRGAAPIQRAILAGDTETGVTIIRMNTELDTGDILASSAVPIAPDENSATLMHKLLAVGPALLVSTLRRLENNAVTPRPQGKASTYARKISKEEAQVDWSVNAAQVARHIRAFNPNPVAYSFLGEMRVRFWQADPTPGEGKPGSILDVCRNGVTIACGSGAILCNALQLPLGKGAISTGRDLLNARQEVIYRGARFVARRASGDA